MNRLACRDVILDYLADYLDARLDAEALAEFERHPEHWTARRADLRTYHATREMVRRAGRAPMPQEMKTRLHRFLPVQLTDGQP